MPDSKLLFVDGFSHYGTSLDDCIAKWGDYTHSGSSAITSSPMRSGMNALRIQGNTTSNTPSIIHAIGSGYPDRSSGEQLAVGVLMKQTEPWLYYHWGTSGFGTERSVPGNNIFIFGDASGLIRLRLYVDWQGYPVISTEELTGGYWGVSGSYTHTFNEPLKVEQPYYIVLHMYVQQETGPVDRMYATLYVQGKDLGTTEVWAEAPAITIDWRTVSLCGAMGRIQGSDPSYHYYNDFYISNGQSDVTPLYPTVRQIFPTSDDTAQWSPSSSPAGSNYEEVDDTDNDENSTYNSSSSTGDIDLFGMGDLDEIYNDITGIQQVSVANAPTAGTNSIYNRLTSGTTTQDGTEHFVGNDYGFYLDQYVYDIDTSPSSAWTRTAINALKSGYKKGS